MVASWPASSRLAGCRTVGSFCYPFGCCRPTVEVEHLAAFLEVLLGVPRICYHQGILGWAKDTYFASCLLDTLAAFVQGRNKYLVVLHPVEEALLEPEIEEVP